MSDLRVELDRGAKAEKLLSDPILDEAFQLVREAIHEQWESAPLRDQAGAHELKLMLKLLSDVRANLERAVMDGKLAVAELERHRTLSPAQFRAAYR